MHGMMEVSRRARVLAKSVLPPPALDASRAVRQWWRQRQQRAFDCKYGLDTASIVETVNHDGTRYEATPRRLFKRILAGLQIQYSDFSFIDIGSGKGAVLLYAASFPFKRIVGIEWSRQLHEIAEANIRTYSRRLDKRPEMIESVCMDARDYQFMSDPMVVYFANPFGRRIMREVLRNIEKWFEAAPREIYIIYYLPIDDVFETSRWFRRLVTGMNYSVYRAHGH